MLIPWGTDAPLYHWPIATVSMIVANVAAFAGVSWLSANVPEATFIRIVGELTLTYGNGLRPWQWITSNFMHAGLLHLLGNMFCLWGFGLIVEGKIGWWRFLAIYFGIGITQCAVEQTLMLFAQGGSLGASSIIFGLLAIGMVWAPRNEMNCILFIFRRPIAFDASLYMIAVVMLMLQMVLIFVAGLGMSSAALHLMGAGIGFAVAVAMLQRNWVDCEGSDLLSVWFGRETGGAGEEKARRAAASLSKEAQRSRRQEEGRAAAPRPESHTALDMDDLFADSSAPSDFGLPSSEATIDDLRQALKANDSARAFEIYRELADNPLVEQPPERELLRIIAGFHQRRQWSASVPPMKTYLRHFTRRAPQIRLKLVQILLQVEKRPDQAVAELKKVNLTALSDKERALWKKLRDHAAK